MLSLPLDPTVSHASPAFRTAAGCALWLGQLQLTNLRLAHDALRKQLNELNRYTLPAPERLRIMELLRETVADIQADYAGKLSGKKLPLNTGEFAILVAITGLWQGMSVGYQRCLQAFFDGDTQLADQAALLCQRCLLYSSLQITEHVHGCHEFDGKLWQRLHALYACSEERNWCLQEINSGLGGAVRALSCRTIYVHTLLACHAHRAGLTRHQMQILDQWLTLWSPTVSVERGHSIGQEEVAALAVDLGSSQGLQIVPQLSAPASLRCLPMTQISKMLRVKAILLQQGQSPQQLELGAGCSRSECITLLNTLHQYWCEPPGERAARLPGTEQYAQICYGMDGCFAYIANRPFRQPEKNTAVDTLSRKQIETFGQVLSESRHQDLSGLGYTRESWLIQNASPLGARLLRTQGTARIGHRQLLALRPDQTDAYILGTVRWVNVTLDGQLQAGVRYLPGTAQAVAMKATGVNLTVSDQYVAALLLPALAELEVPASLIIPRNWFRPGLVVEIVAPDKNRLLAKMGISVDKGLDYERVSYTEI